MKPQKKKPGELPAEEEMESGGRSDMPACKGQETFPVGKKEQELLTYEEWEKRCQRKPATVRNYKDTVFRMLFNDKKELLALYNAVNGTHYMDPEALQITTLESAIYMSMKNDLSFILDMRLDLYEHSSTVNPNIPLRDLIYVAKVLEELVIHKDLYARKLIRLPSPGFITFYNGREKQPERRESRLSDAYYVKGAEPSLELVVVQLNINPGYNEELKERCPTLKQYMDYVGRIRTYEKEQPLAEAVERAVDECIREGILEDFLRKNKARVVSMSIYEYDEELHRKTLYEEGLEDGREEGREEGADLKLISLVCRKLRKGKEAEEIAEDLEEDLEIIGGICEAAKETAPEYNTGKIYELLQMEKV